MQVASRLQNAAHAERNAAVEYSRRFRPDYGSLSRGCLLNVCACNRGMRNIAPGRGCHPGLVKSPRDALRSRHIAPVTQGNNTRTDPGTDELPGNSFVSQRHDLLVW